MLVERMRRRGFIPLAEAAERASCSRSTLLNYVRAKKIDHERCNYFFFLKEASFLERFPHVKGIEKEESEAAS